MVEPHPLASSIILPWFITEPGQTDVLLVVMGVGLLIFALIVGVLFLRLHHLPEHIAQKHQKMQYEIVAILGLLAMFTHIQIFWIAGLLLAMIDLPDFTGPLGRIADAVARIAGRRRAI